MRVLSIINLDILYTLFTVISITWKLLRCDVVVKKIEKAT